MIDVDALEDQLEQAVVRKLRGRRSARSLPPPQPPAPANASADPPGAAAFLAALRRSAPETRSPAVEPGPRAPSAPSAPRPAWDTGLGIAEHASRVVALMSQARLAEADVHIGAHAALAERTGTAADRLDAAVWAVMRALLDGRREDARNGAEGVLALGRDAGDPATGAYWGLRLRMLLAWSGDENDEAQLLDYCRERAYRHGELPWRAALTLLLARLGRKEEGQVDFDGCWEALEPFSSDADWLDMVTDLAEAAAVMGDTRRAERVRRALARVPRVIVLSGPAWVCKGSSALFRARAAAAAGMFTESDQEFHAAVEDHRRLGAEPLLAQALEEWGSSLVGRDDVRARTCLHESAAIKRRLARAAARRDAARPTPALSRVAG